MRLKSLMITNNKHDDNEQYNKRRCKKKNLWLIYNLPIIVIDLSLYHLGTLNFFHTERTLSNIEKICRASSVEVDILDLSLLPHFSWFFCNNKIIY